MNAADILKYGHGTVAAALDHLPDSAWDSPGVCGHWSVKNIIAHLASYEQVLIEVLSGFGEAGPTPNLDRYTDPHGNFNDGEVAARAGLTAAETLDEYNRAAELSMALIAAIPEEVRRRPGALPWYGMEYALDDYIVYAFYGHKREHCAQIHVFRDRLAG